MHVFFWSVTVNNLQLSYFSAYHKEMANSLVIGSSHRIGFTHKTLTDVLLNCYVLLLFNVKSTLKIFKKRGIFCNFKILCRNTPLPELQIEKKF